MDPHVVNLILMGLRGSGKSTLARRLSAATGLAFVDLDDRVASMLGHPTAADAWNNAGEPAFRAAEVRALSDALAEAAPIISLGGGTPIAPGAERLLLPLKRTRPPRLVYLRAPAETLAARVRDERAMRRPSLTGADPADEMAVIFARRDPVYLRLADATLEVGELSVEGATTRLLDLMRD